MFNGKVELLSYRAYSMHFHYNSIVVALHFVPPPFVPISICSFLPVFRYSSLWLHRIQRILFYPFFSLPYSISFSHTLNLSLPQSLTHSLYIRCSTTFALCSSSLFSSHPRFHRINSITIQPTESGCILYT